MHQAFVITTPPPGSNESTYNMFVFMLIFGNIDEESKKRAHQEHKSRGGIADLVAHFEKDSALVTYVFEFKYLQLNELPGDKEDA